jgi:hypothetical protein
VGRRAVCSKLGRLNKETTILLTTRDVVLGSIVALFAASACGQNRGDRPADGVTSTHLSPTRVSSSNAGAEAGEPSPDAAPPACNSAEPAQTGGSWVNQWFADPHARFQVELDATPSVADIDAVIGLAGRSASRFTDLAAIVRFNADGFIDARNGAAYAASSAISYAPGATVHLLLDVDRWHRTYTAQVRSPGSSTYTTIGTNYAFRTEQSQIALFTDLAEEVDGPAGSLDVCNVLVSPDPHQMLSLTALGSGPAYSLALPPDGRTLASHQGSTVTLDANGALTGTSPYGGKIAVDGASNVIVAGSFTGSIDLGTGAPLTSAGGADIYIAKYDPAWHPLWAERMGGAGDEELLALSVSPGGDVVFDATGLGTLLLGPDGSTGWTDPAPGVAVAFDPSGNVFRLDDAGGAVTVAKLDPKGATLWSRTFAGTGAQLPAVIASDANGNAILGGKFSGDIAFGGATLHYPPSHDPEAPPYAGFLVKLGPDGAYSYSALHGILSLSSVASGPLGEAVITGQDFADPAVLSLVKYDADGNQVWAQSAPQDIEHGGGFGRAVAVDPAGQILWSADALHGSQVQGGLVAYVARFQP